MVLASAARSSSSPKDAYGLLFHAGRAAASSPGGSRGRPAVWVARCSSRTGSRERTATAGQWAGSRRSTASCRASSPRAAIAASSSAVNVLLTEPSSKTVSGVHGPARPRPVRPAHRTSSRSPRTTATVTAVADDDTAARTAAATAASTPLTRPPSPAAPGPA